MNTKTQTHTQDKTIETNVLYQKMGDTWYAFAEIDGEVLFRALPHGMNPKKTQIDFMQVIADQEEKKAKNLEMAA